VKPPSFEYHQTRSVEEAVAVLAEHGDEAKVLAGGQSLVPLLALRLSHPSHLVDINRAGELAAMANGNDLVLGAIVRHRTVETSGVVQAASPLLAYATRFIGHRAIRNRGTVGGSIAHADPAAELPTVLAALDGAVDARGAQGTRTIPASELFAGFLTTSIGPDELLTAVRIPPWPAGAGWSFHEFSRRSGDFAVVAVAATVRLGQAGTVAEVRLAFSGVSTRPVRATAAESTLAGAAPSDHLWHDGAREAAAALEPASDLHGSAAYRKHLAAVLAERALREAHQRATEA
jgi:aerobic carbon-monoxide dehydrogenase medium subunit